MDKSDAQQICHLIARTIDALESVAREAGIGELEFVRLHNIRHDAIKLLNRFS